MTSWVNARCPVSPDASTDGRAGRCSGCSAPAWAPGPRASRRCATEPAPAPGELGLALIALTVGALVAAPIAARATGRSDHGAVLWVGCCSLCAGVAMLGAAASVAGLVAGLATLGFGQGLLEVGANATALEVERRTGRSLLSRWHACFAFGTVVAAGVGAGSARLGVGVAVHFGVVASSCLALGGAAATRLRRIEVPRAGRLRQRQAGPVALLAAAALCAFYAEAGTVTWSSTYLRDELGASAAVGAIGSATVPLSFGVGRLGGDRLSGRLGPLRLLGITSVIAAGGLAAGALVRSGPGAIAALATFGAAAGLASPVLFRSASAVGGGAGVAAVAGVGYVGYALAPALTGVMAGAEGLRPAFMSLALVQLGVAVVARATAVRHASAAASAACTRRVGSPGS